MVDAICTHGSTAFVSEQCLGAPNSNEWWPGLAHTLLYHIRGSVYSPTILSPYVNIQLGTRLFEESQDV